MDMVRILAAAAFGGLMLNLMSLWEDSKKAKADRAPKDELFWLFFFVWPAVGAALAYLYLLDGSTLRPLLAFSVGLSAPTTIRSLMCQRRSDSRPAGRSKSRPLLMRA
jgi:hypothetical protein